MQDQADVKDEYNESIKVIVRQRGLDGFDVYFPKREMVFQSNTLFTLRNILRSLDPDTAL